MKYPVKISQNLRPWLPVLGIILLFALLFVVDNALGQEQLQDQAQKAVKPVTAKSQLFKLEFARRLGTNLVSVLVLVMFVYLPIHRKKDYFFTFLVLNFLVFIMTYLINMTTAFRDFGTAVGLLAFFSLLRLRTDTISMKDMTYLFIVLTLGLINATMTGPVYELIILDGTIIVLAYVLDKDWLSKSILSREMQLDSLEFIVPQDMDKLLVSLRTQTGLDIQRLRILSVDLVKKRAVVQVYHY